MNTSSSARARLAALATGLVALVSLALLVQCRSSGDGEQSVAPASAGLDAWAVVYRVLQHPRCVNCHPAGDVPLQGDEGLPHAQAVARGEDGQGLFAQRCSSCHLAENLAGEHMPPGAPHWQMGPTSMPMVFEGKSSGELCRQLKDPARNGGKSVEQVYEHLAKDPLVLWGWSPGEGRAPVGVPHAELVRGARAWVDAGCPSP
jgi:mono/diheme cytochrome c family protein